MVKKVQCNKTFIHLQVLSNPYEDIVPRQLPKKKSEHSSDGKKRKSKSKATKYYFGILLLYKQQSVDILG